MDLLLLSLIQCFTPEHFGLVRIPSNILHLINSFSVGRTTLHPIPPHTSQAFPHTWSIGQKNFIARLSERVLRSFHDFLCPSSEGVMRLLVSAATPRNDDNYILTPSNQEQSNNKHPVIVIRSDVSFTKFAL